MIVPLSEPNINWVFILLIVLGGAFLLVELVKYINSQRQIKYDVVQKQRILNQYHKLYVNNIIPFNEKKIVNMDFDDDPPHGIYYVTVIKKNEVILGVEIIRATELEREGDDRDTYHSTDS